MKQAYLSCLWVVVLLVAVVPAGLAAPSFLGFTGLLYTPTADVLSQGEWNAAIFTFGFEHGGDANDFLANLGIAGNLEVGFTKVRVDDEDEVVVVDGNDRIILVRGGEAEGTFLNLKYQFLQETQSHPAVAAGLLDITDEVEATVYVVASKAFGQCYETRLGEITSPRFHIGVGGGQLSSFFGGVSAGLGDRFLVMLEYDSENVNAGARFSFNDEWKVHFGFLNGFNDIGFGVSYNKGL